MNDKIHLGVRFVHRSMIIGSPKAGTARPDVCTVTRVAGRKYYYRNESGMLFVRYVEDGIPGTLLEES